MDKEKKEYGCFAELVLLSTNRWDEHKFVDDFKRDWNILLHNSGPNDLVGSTDVMRIQTSIMSEQAPGRHSEVHTQEGSRNIYKSHRTHILIAISAENSDLLECGKLLAGAVSSCLKQEGSVAVYTEGALFDPLVYIGITPFIRRYPDILLAPKAVCLGVHLADGHPGIYTYGMQKCGYQEMEIYTDSDLSEVKDFLLNVVLHTLDSDTILREGENTVSDGKFQYNAILSDGVAVDGKSLKIEYPQQKNISNN